MDVSPLTHVVSSELARIIAAYERRNRVIRQGPNAQIRPVNLKHCP